MSSLLFCSLFLRVDCSSTSSRCLAKHGLLNCEFLYTHIYHPYWHCEPKNYFFFTIVSLLWCTRLLNFEHTIDLQKSIEHHLLIHINVLWNSQSWTVNHGIFHTKEQIIFLIFNLGRFICGGRIKTFLYVLHLNP